MLLSIFLTALLPPTQASDTLQGVTVIADRGVVVSRTDTLSLENISSSDELVYLAPSLGLSDYGGLSGLKSISLRGLGSAHTAVYIDGVKASNVQSGQPDLSFIDFRSLSSTVIDYAQNSISFNTARPVFTSGQSFRGRASLEAGSFGTWMPSARLDFRLSDKVGASANLGALWSRGDYPLADGTRRTNNDIRQFKAGADFWGSLHRGEWHAKAYLNSAARGVPGSSTYPSDDRQDDANAFIQGSLHKAFSDLYTLDLSAKASLDEMFYTSSWGDNEYHQKGLQLNSTHRFALGKRLGTAVTASVSHDALKADSYEASRTGITAGISASLDLRRLDINAGVQYDTWLDAGRGSRQALSPWADLTLDLGGGAGLNAFVRRAYRVPTFNELYYAGYGNPELRPEDAVLSGLGLKWNRSSGDGWKLTASLDGFYNLLKDRISSAPTEEDPNIWLPYNIGRVEVLGAEAGLSLGHEGTRLDWGLRLKYAFQDATDRTPDGSSYGMQVPYIARHSLSAGAHASCRGWSASLDWILRCGRFDSYGQLPDWSSLNISAGKEFSLSGRLALRLGVKALNLLDCRYEAVRYYPLPGRSLQASVAVTF